MTIELKRQDILKEKCDLLVVYLFQHQIRLQGDASRIDKALDGAISQIITQDEFEGKLGQAFAFPIFTVPSTHPALREGRGSLGAKKVAVIGLGEKRSLDADAVRKVGAHLVKLAEREHASSVVTSLPGDAEAFTEGILLSAHRFHTFHGTQRKKDKAPKELARVTICEMDQRVVKHAEEGIARARVLAAATNYARDLVNTPSSHMTPSHLAEEARKLVGRNISVHIMDKKELERRKMRAALAVGCGSQHDPVGAHLIYRPHGAKKKIVIVGKAVTFDSGGLSLKPADSMMTMKCDMGGAAAVLGLFQALAHLSVPVEVHGIFLAVENMPSGNAYRPGDIVTAMDGTTIEILNTDAEGRVTLADALSYAATLKPDTIIDLATLTGACVVALGEDIAGMFATHAKLAQKLLAASKEVGEPLWQLPLYEPYAEHVKSKIADLKNIGAHGGGSITAALFLKPFVGDIPWAHLDIAGPAYTEKESRPDQPYGASGFGVRLLAKYLERL